MELRIRTVRVTELEGGAERFGVIAEGEGGRTLVALAASSEEELKAQLDDVGGAAAYLRRFGAEPLDPAGIGVQGSGGAWVPALEPEG